MTKSEGIDDSESPSDPDELRWKGDYPITQNKTVTTSFLVVSTISVGLVAMLGFRRFRVRDSGSDALFQ